MIEEYSLYNITHTFPGGICQKENVIARLEFELAYYDSAVHHFNQEETPIMIDLEVQILVRKRNTRNGWLRSVNST